MLTLLKLLVLLGLWETAEDDEPDDDEPEDEPEAEEEEDEEDEGEEQIRDPVAKVKSLSEANERLARKNRKLEKRLAEAADDSTTRVEAAFWRELATGQLRIGDHESAWDLFTARGFADLVKVSDEGEVSGMGDALGKLVDRYPWLSDEPATPDADALRTLRRTAPPPRRKRAKTGPSFTREELQKRMPSLRKHR